MENTLVLVLLLDSKYSSIAPTTILMRFRYFTVASLRLAFAAHGNFRRTDYPAIPVGVERPILAGQCVYLQRQRQLRDIQAEARRRRIVAVFFHQFGRNGCRAL